MVTTTVMLTKRQWSYISIHKIWRSINFCGKNNMQSGTSLQRYRFEHEKRAYYVSARSHEFCCLDRNKHNRPLLTGKVDFINK